MVANSNLIRTLELFTLLLLHRKQVTHVTAQPSLFRLVNYQHVALFIF